MYGDHKRHVDVLRNCFTKFDQNNEIEYQKFSIDQKMNLLQILVSIDQMTSLAGSGR